MDNRRGVGTARTRRSDAGAAGRRTGGFAVLAVLLLLLLGLPAPARALDFWVDLLGARGPSSHVKTETAPTTTARLVLDKSLTKTQFAVCGDTVQVLIEMVDSADQVKAATTVEVDICDIDAANYVDVDVPLYTTAGNLNLPPGDYRFVATVDPDDQWPEADESNNRGLSLPFFYATLSGEVRFGPVLTTMTMGRLEAPGATCAGFDHRIGAGTGSWDHAWGASPLDYAGLCANSSPNADGFSLDLAIASGSLALGDFAHTVAGLAVTVNAVTLDATGMAYTGAVLQLPDNTTAHTLDSANLIHPRGRGSFTFAGKAGVTDFTDIVLKEQDTWYFHGYGLPFYVKADGFQLRLAATAGVELLTADPVYVHADRYTAAMIGDDPRHLHGVPANDQLFFAGTGGSAVILGSGLKGTFQFDSAAGVNNTGLITATPEIHFPRAQVDWPAFAVQVDQGRIVPGPLGDVQFRLTVDGSCPEAACAGASQVFQGTVKAGITADVAFGGLADPGSPVTQWGKSEPGLAPTFSHDDTGHPRVFMAPGVLLPGTTAAPGESEEASAPNYLLGSWDLLDADLPGAPHLLGATTGQDASHGNHYFAGLTYGPASLVPLDGGFTGTIDDTQLEIRFDGNSTATAFGLKPFTKYVLRPAGLTGVFNSDFSGAIHVYGYEISLDRFAFRQVANRLDSETWLDGHIDLPYPAGLHVVFSNLDLTCTGNLGDGEVAPGRDQLDYWNVPVKFLGMGFAYDSSCPGSAGGCPDAACRFLQLVNENTLGRVAPDGFVHTALWNPDGTPRLADESLTGPPQVRWDPPPADGATEPGFGARVQAGYLDHPAAYPTAGTGGFHALRINLDTPLFDDPDLFAHVEDGTIQPDWSVDPYTSKLWLFKDEAGTDPDKDGVPAAYPDLATYRDLSLRHDENLATDPRPPLHYEWPGSGALSFDYRAVYSPTQRVGGANGNAQQAPRLLGILKTTPLPQAVPVITVQSLPDYLTPDETRISFGASASVQELKNAFVDFASQGVDDFLQGTLGVSDQFSLDTALAGIKETTAAIHQAAGGDVTELFSGILLADLEGNGTVTTAVDHLAGVVSGIHGAPAAVTTVLLSRIQDGRDTARSRYTGGLDDSLTALYQKFAPFVLYSPAVLADAIANNKIQPGPPLAFDTMAAEVAQLQARLEAMRTALTAARDGLGGVRADLVQARTDLAAATAQVHQSIAALKTALHAMTAYTSSDMAANPLLARLDQVQQQFHQLIGLIQGLDLAGIATALDDAAAAYGADLDTRFVTDAQEYLDQRAGELEQLVTGAQALFAGTVPTLGLANVFGEADTLLDDMEAHLNGVTAAMDVVFVRVLDCSTGGACNDGGALAVLAAGLDGLLQPFDRLAAMLADGSALPPSSWPAWSDLVTAGQQRLDEELAHQVVVLLADPAQGAAGLAGLAAGLAAGHPSTPYAGLYLDLYVTQGETLVTTPFDHVSALFAGELATARQAVVQMIPDMRPEDIRQLLLTGILNSPPVHALNNAFFSRFGVVSDYVDQLNGQLSAQVNGVIQQAIVALQDGIAASLANIDSPVGGTGNSGDEDMYALKINGYAVVLQDELSRLHMEAEFRTDGDPDPTTYNAALDVMAWNGENGKSEECAGASPDAALYDVTISTHDVPLNMMNSDLSLKEALLGFTIDGGSPKGVFGRVYTGGELKVEQLRLWDLGLEAGVGMIEVYVGARGKGIFNNATLAAVFFAGKSCDTEIIKRLDPEVGDFIGEKPNGFAGFFCRGSVSVPIYDYSCLLRIGAGVDVGAWYFAAIAGDPETYGGLLGGEVWGQGICLASVKGKITMIGGSVGGAFKFKGTGWAAAGIGFCDPEEWFTLQDTRDDGGCLTGDASLTCEYYQSFDVDYSIDCCY